jgi:hypothetical protein
MEFFKKHVNGHKLTEIAKLHTSFICFFGFLVKIRLNPNGSIVYSKMCNCDYYSLVMHTSPPSKTGGFFVTTS